MTKTAGTKEWAELTRNCCKGCKNDCKYCYAKANAIRFKRTTEELWKKMIFNPSFTNSAVGKQTGRIMFPTTHDLHYEHREEWMPFLAKMLSNGNHILIVTKPEFEAVKLICETFWSYNSQIEFRFTIGTIDETVREFWEPGAPPINERIQAVLLAYEMGYETSLSLEPLLDINPKPFVVAIDHAITGTIWIGTMNHMQESWFVPEERHWYYRQCFINSSSHMLSVYESLKDNPKVRWKDTVREMLGLP